MTSTSKPSERMNSWLGQHSELHSKSHEPPINPKPHAQTDKYHPSSGQGSGSQNDSGNGFFLYIGFALIAGGALSLAVPGAGTALGAGLLICGITSIVVGIYHSNSNDAQVPSNSMTSPSCTKVSQKADVIDGVINPTF